MIPFFSLISYESLVPFISKKKKKKKKKKNQKNQTKKTPKKQTNSVDFIIDIKNKAFISIKILIYFYALFSRCSQQY